MTDDQLNELLEAMRAQTETMNSVTNRLGDIGIIMAKNVTGNAKGVKDYNDALSRLRDTTEGLTRLEELALKQKEAEIERESNRKAAAQQSVQALKSFASALLDSGNNFAKYGKVLDSAGDAAVSLGKNFGALGAAAGYAVKGLTAIGSAALQQADNVLKANDALSKSGAANSFNTEQIMSMAHQVGLTTSELDKLIKPATTLGGGLRVLGASSAEGVKSFKDINAELLKSSKAFQRLGFDDEARIKATADYVTLLQKSNAGLTQRQITEGNLAKQAKEYTENLVILADLTGKDVEDAKKQQEINRATYEWTLQQNKWQQQRLEMERKGDTAGLARLDAEEKAAGKLIDDIGRLGDPSKTAAVQLRYLTGAVTKGSAQFDILGVNIDEQIKAAKEGTYEQGQASDAYRKGAQRFIDSSGIALGLSESLQSATGLTMNTVGEITRMNSDLSKGMTQEQIAAKKRREIEANEAGKGPAATDPAQKARNELTEAQRKARITVDALTGSMNPLLKGFNGATTAATVLTGAATAAALALGAVAAAGKMTSGVPGSGGAGGGAGGPRGGAGAGGGARGLASKALGFAGRVAAPLAVVGGGIQAYSGYKGAEAEQAAGTITPAQATVKKSEAVGEGAGSAIGGIIGGALGSFLLPGVGTIAGAAVGSYIGGYFGKEAGTAAGTSKAKAEAAAANEKGILDLIGRVESGGNYNILVGGKTKANPPLTEMTVGQVLDFQSGMRQMGHESTAVGKYQIIRGTLAGLFQEGVVGYNDKFDQSTQDKLAAALLKRRGFEKYKSGELTPEAFADNLAKEWASLPMANGQSYYAGTGSNKSLVSRDDVLKAIGITGAEATAVATASPTAPGPKEAQVPTAKPVAVPPMLATAAPAAAPAVASATPNNSTAAPAMPAPIDTSKMNPMARREIEALQKYNNANVEAHRAERKEPKAARGGIFSGSVSGYPVELHGDELVAPIDPNSILAKMLTAGPGQAETLAQSNPVVKSNASESDASKELVAINMSILEMMSTKLDTVIDRLGTSNDIQDKLLKYSSV